MKKYLPLFICIIYFSNLYPQTVIYHEEFSGCIDKIAIDEDNDVLWMGTTLSSGGDLFMRDKNGNKTDLSELTNTINFQSITALWMNESTLYVGGYGGIAIIDPEADEYTLYTTQNSNYSNSNVPNSLVYDYNSELLYAGNLSTSTDVLDENGWTRDNSLKKISASTFDYEEDVLWLASTSGELIKIVNDTKTVFNSTNSSIPALPYIDITIDTEGNIYLLVSQNGFVHYDGINATHYTPQNSDLFGGDLNSIDVDNNGKVWFGHNGGITSFKNGSFKTYTLEDAVGFWPTIEDIVVDNNNHLWLGACGGLIEFSLDPTNTKDELDTSISVYPNPNYGQFNFKSAEKGMLRLYDHSGKRVSEHTITAGSNALKLTNQTGIFYYSFNGKSGKISIQ